MAGTSYTRQSTFIDGDTITALLFNAEYDHLLTVFSYASSGSTGHRHDGSAGEGGNIYRIGDQDFKNKIEADSAGNQWTVSVEVGGTATERVHIDVDGLDVTGNINVSGTVDGRDVATDGAKLDGIEAGATAGQTDVEIRALVESATDSNVFTDADHTKLDGIEVYIESQVYPDAIVVSADSTLVKGVPVYVSTATTTQTLPASPTAGDTVPVMVGNFTDTIIARNGSNIMSLGENITLDKENIGLTFRYVDATRGWIFV